MIKIIRLLKFLPFLIIILTAVLLPVAYTQSVTGIYTDYAGWWSSSVNTVNPVKPNDKNNLLGFTTVRTVAGVPTNRTFSTGIDDNLLTSKGISFTPGDYRALPVGTISGVPGTSTYVGIGSNYGGVNQATTHPSLTNPMNYYLTDGKKGLDMGTAVFNIQSGSILYKVDEFNIAAIGDGMPDIVATQMGDYPSTNDIFKFVDVNGNTVGNQLTLNFSQVLGVGNATWAFYQVPTTAPYTPMPYGGPHGDRLIRLQAWDLSDFGLNQSNVGRIARFVHTLSGNSDPGFMAYNTTGLRALTTITPGCGIASPGLWLQANDGISAESGKITKWNDQSSKALHMEQSSAGSRPTYREGNNAGFNFNPYIDFDNGNWLGHANGPFNVGTTTTGVDNFDVFIVARATATTGTNKVLGFSRNSADVSSASKGDYPAFSFGADKKLNLTYDGSFIASGNATQSAISGLWQMNYTKSTSTITSSLNGVASGNGTGTMDLGTWYTQLGDASPGDNQSDFDVAEVIVFPANITADQKQKTSSYLGIKYGISLPFSYVSGGGQTIWDYSNNIYNNNIIGVGREDCQGLAQKQSSAIGDARNLLTIGMTSIASSTKENLTTMADGQFMLWGDNNGSLSTFTSLQAKQLCLKKPGIEWRNQRTGGLINTQGTQVKIHVSEIPWAEGATQNSAGNYYLLIDRNSNGSYQDAGDVAIPATSLDGGYATFNNVIWDNDGSGTDLFTIALKVAEVPVLSAIAGSNTVCVGSTTEQTNSATGGVWSSGNTSVATVNASTGVVTGLQPGTAVITYVVTNSRGCETLVTKEIVVNSIATATILGGGTVCEGQPVPAVSISFTGTGPWSFSYSNGTTNASLTNITSNPYVITTPPSGVYSLTALSNANCAGTFSGSATVTIVSAPIVNAIQPACTDATGTIEVLQPLGAGITYSINGVDYQASATFANLAPGTYNIGAKFGSCTTPTSAVTINPSPTAPTPVVIQPTCSVATGTITIPAVAGSEYSINGSNFQSNNVFGSLTPGDYNVVVRVGSCLSPAQSVTIQSQPATPAAPSTAALSYCKGVTASPLSATGNNLLWYSSSSGGVGSARPPTPDTETIGTKLYYVSQSANGCESPRSSVSVTVKSVPAVPSVSVVNNCDGTSNLTASNYSGTLLWNNGQSTPGITVSTAGTYTVAQTIDGCVSPAASGVAAPRSIPPTPVIAVVDNCNNTSTITATNATGTLLWSNGSDARSQIVNIAETYYLVQTINGCTSAPASATTAPKAPTSAPTVSAVNNCGSSVLTATGAGSILWNNGMTTNAITVTTTGNFTVTRTVNGCVSPAATIASAPKSTTAPTGNANQTFCASNLPTVANLVATGTGIKWYTTSSGGTALTSTSPLTNATTYYASQTLADCESVNRFTVTVTVNSTAAPTGNTAQVFCKVANPTIASLTATGNDIKWYAASSGGSALSSSTALVTGQIYYASQTANGCESAERLAVTVTLNEVTVPTGNATQVFCKDSNPTIASLTATGNDIKWYSTSSNGTALLSSTVLVDGEIYYSSQTLNGCESAERLAVTVTLSETTVPTGDAVQVFCKDSNPTMASLIATGSNIKWYATSSDGTALLLSTALVDGEIYYASQTLNGCESAERFAVTVTLNETTVPTGDAVQAFCKDSNPTLADLIVTGSNIKWYATNTDGIAILSSTALVNGEIYYASQTLNGCESAERLAVTVTLNETVVPTGEAIQVFCENSNPTLADLIATGSNIKWYATNTDGIALLSSTALVDGEIYYASQALNDCESAERFAVTVKIDDSPTVSAAGDDQQQCNDSKFITSANVPLVGTGKWAVVSGSAIIADEFDPTTEVIVEAGATAVLSWTVSNGSCSVSSSTVTLSNTLPASAGADQTQPSTEFTLAADNSLGIWQIVSVVPGNLSSSVVIADATLYNSKITVPYGALATLSWTVNGSSCTDLVVLTNNVAMPVNLISFTARAQEQKVVLNWSTSAETNNAGFNIERSADAQTFKVIGYKPANTESDTKLQQDYHFVDEQPISGINYYRLVQKDYDGKITYYRVVSVNMEVVMPKVELYPNPSYKTVYFKNFLPGSKVTLINMLGRSISVTDRDQLNVTDLVSGVYFIKIENGKNVQTLKFVKD
jgi:uncharacterized membrane protein